MKSFAHSILSFGNVYDQTLFHRGESVKTRWILLTCKVEEKTVQVVGVSTGSYMAALRSAKSRSQHPVFAVRVGQNTEDLTLKLFNWFDKIGIIPEEKMLVLAAVGRALSRLTVGLNPCADIPESAMALDPNSGRVIDAEVTHAVAPESRVEAEIERANGRVEIVSSSDARVVPFTSEHRQEASDSSSREEETPNSS